MDTTERLHFHFSLSCIGEGTGNPLQCSCLENPRDGGVWWAAVYGVAQSWTRLKRLSSSSSILLLSHPKVSKTHRYFSSCHLDPMSHQLHTASHDMVSKFPNSFTTSHKPLKWSWPHWPVSALLWQKGVTAELSTSWEVK